MTTQSTTAQPVKQPATYERSGLISAHVVALLFWFVLWCLNGASTVAPLAILGARLGALGTFIGIGACLHLAISLIEHHLWRSRDRATYPLILCVGLWDIGTASLSLLVVLTFLGVASFTPGWYVGCTIVAEVIAIASEPMMVLHWRHLRRVTR